jgi:energy-coupling factor transporter ATP-binding protein EcfA2
MLHELRIANLAVIEQSEITFGPGLNVLTGETGAGKSILISALGLLIGERAAAEQAGNGKAFVEGIFNLSRSPGAQSILAEQGIELEDGNGLLVTREISTEGRNRVRLNGRLATAGMLREIGCSKANRILNFWIILAVKNMPPYSRKLVKPGTLSMRRKNSCKSSTKINNSEPNGSICCSIKSMRSTASLLRMAKMKR